MQTFDGFERISERQQICNADCFDALRAIPDGTADLIFTDPPYNIKRINKKKEAWDTFRADEYNQFMMQFIREATRCAKDNATLLMWHNNMPFIAQFMEQMRLLGEWDFVSFVIWHKEGYLKLMKANSANRSFPNGCEYLLHFTRNKAARECAKKLAAAMCAELSRLGFTKDDFAAKYAAEYPEASGAMVGHWFAPPQFVVPSREVYDRVFRPLGFDIDCDAMRDELNTMRPYFDNADGEKSGNVYSLPCVRYCEDIQYHPCQKPLYLLADIMQKTCPQDGIILDPFAGSMSVAVAAEKTKRCCISIERDAKYFQDARARLLQETHHLGL